MAVKADYGEEGFPWWLEWSRTMTRNNFPGEVACREKWDGFRKFELTTRSLRHLAEEGSGEMMPKYPREDFDGVPVDEVELYLLDTKPASGKNKRKSSIPILDVNQFLKRPRPHWRVKGLLPETGLALIFGASGSGKTFLANEFSLVPRYADRGS